MSDVQRSGWADNPFTFSITHGITPAEPMPFGMGNFLKDFFEKLKAKYVKMPPAKIQPVEPIATTQWSPEMGMGQTLTDRFAPNPAFIGLPLKRKDVTTSVGTKGWNTHYNIMVDQSGSMGAIATEFEGKQCDRTIVCRLATACLIKQASYNVDSFTVFSYNDRGKLLWNLSGEPAYNYEDCIEWLTSESISKVWNIVENNKGSSTQAWSDGGENNMINALAPMVADGDNNEDSAFDVMVSNSQKYDIQGMITVFITDGDSLSAPITHNNPSLTGSLTYDQWMRQFGHLFYILIRSESEQRTMKQYKASCEANLMKTYGWDRKLASKFVWCFPDPRMKDSDGEPITDVGDQMGWLFAEIGKIFAGTSEEFADLAEELGVIGHDGTYTSPVLDED